jgi:hypothetical protein
MKLRTKAAIIIVVGLAVAMMLFVPIVPGPHATCNSNALCVPNQKLSITENYLGFGTESSHHGTLYYFCGLSNISGFTYLPPC